MAFYLINFKKWKWKHTDIFNCKRIYIRNRWTPFIKVWNNTKEWRKLIEQNK